MPTTDRTETAVRPLPQEGEVDTVLRACRILVAITARSLAAVPQVTDPLQMRAMVVLRSRETLSLGQLARSVGIHLTRASRLCDRLVSQGLVDRTDDPANRRQLLLRLTAEGRDVVDEVMRQRAEAIQPVLARMAPASRRALVRALGDFDRAAEGFEERELWAMGWTS
ncbi:MarR family winged helix-turn-helix transcriptional regulator [Humibacillus xanthopallidus]|uniref:MarR family winged helix-turn-helix transcriptional regulator n=1 Tax=Humibacillus xanthopallidus TaxID=412689 RepID=UPI00114D66D5|nr:MarR family transcriptional regulator [Humibacillus xanthopallidus]